MGRGFLKVSSYEYLYTLGANGTLIISNVNSYYAGTGVEYINLTTNYSTSYAYAATCSYYPGYVWIDGIDYSSSGLILNVTQYLSDNNIEIKANDYIDYGSYASILLICFVNGVSNPLQKIMFGTPTSKIVKASIYMVQTLIL